MQWQIKSKSNAVKATVYALEYNGEWMGESYVSLTVESPTPVAFAIGDYLMYRGERFEINYDPGKIKSAPQFAKGNAFKYENVKFNSLADELTRCDFLDVVLEDNQLHFSGLPKFSFYGGVKDLANRIQANLDRTYGKGTWQVVVSPEYSGTKELNVSVDTQKVWDALSILVNDFETYFTIKGRTITIGAAGVPAAHLFKCGKGNGLYEIEQNAEADQAIVTRLRAYGSTRNLPHRYYNSLTGADGKKLIPDNMAVQYLMLPSFPYTTQDPYLDSANKAALGIREGTIFFDGSQEGLEEIYPSIEGMTAEQLKAAGVPCNSTGALDEIVTAEQMTDDGVGDINEGETETTATPPTFKVTLKDLGFDINDHLTTEAATMSFKTGMLGGREFEIVKCTRIASGYELELNRVYDDDIKLWFPYKDYNAKAGDKITILHISMPEVYIKAAAQRLLEAATAWLAKNDYSRSVYAPKVDEIFMARQHDEAMASGGKIASLHDTLKEGMMLLFEDEDLNIDASIFIDQLTIKEGDGPIPTYEITLKEEKTVGRLDKMQNQIDSLSAGQGQGGGYSASQIRSLVDAYGSTRFLSKLKDDRAKGKIASDLGFEVGNYLAGVSGGMIGIDKTDNKSFADVFKLWVHGKAYFETLTIIEAATLAGKQYITPGGSIKCSMVEELTDEDGNPLVYRCYFLSEQDGEKTEAKIVPGDQVISEMFNAMLGTENKVSNHHYWRLVTDVNNDALVDDAGNHYGYIDLSATDCELGSDVPKAGDVINQLGNRSDPNRQAALIFSTVDEDAPSIKMLTGIDYYSLVGKDVISQGYDHASGSAYFNCYGNTYIGDPEGSTYVRYDQFANLLEINARLSVNTTIGDKSFSELLEGFDASEYLRKALPQNTEVIGGVVLSSQLALGYVDEDGWRHTLAGMNGVWDTELGGRTIASWWGGNAVDLFDSMDVRLDPTPADGAKSLVRMDGSAYFANGNIGFKADGSGWLGNDVNGIKFSSNGSMTFGNGIRIALSGGEEGLSSTLQSLLNIAMGLTNLVVPINAAGEELSWAEAIDVKAVKVKTNLLSTGEIVNYATDGSTGSGGVTGGVGGSGWLGAVELGTLAVGDALVWDGRKWTNGTIAATGGIDEAELASYLTGHNYVTAADLSGYVTLGTEQTITGKKKFGWEETVFTKKIQIAGESTGFGALPTLMFHIPNINYSKFVYATDGSLNLVHGAATDLSWSNFRPLSTGYHTIITSSATVKIGSQNSGYVHYETSAPKHWFNKGVCTSGDFYAKDTGGNGQLVWHAGNDGAGSGLDADLLDGCHDGEVTARFLRWKSFTNASEIDFSSAGWTSNGICPDIPTLGFLSGITIGSDFSRAWQLFSGRIAQRIYYRNSKPDMSGWNETIRSVAFLDDNVASATKLQTARNIWGQSFDGSGNVSGTFQLDGNTGGCLSIYDSGTFRAIQTWGSKPLVLNPQGNNVGIYTTSPQAKLHVAGDILATGEITNYSDRRLKSDIREIAPCGRLAPVTYFKDGRRTAGLIAQDVQALLPDAVRVGTDELGLLSLSYNAAWAYGFAEVYCELDDHEERIRRLEALSTKE